jgi:hypothetical protein
MRDHRIAESPDLRLLNQGGSLGPKVFHLGARCLTCGIARQAALPGFEELL